MSLAASLPAEYAAFPKKKGGACGVDQPKIEGDNQFISGWAAISAKDGSLPDVMVVGISANGSEKT